MERMMLHILDSLDRDMRQTVQILSILGREFFTSELILVHKMCLGLERSNDNNDYLFSKGKLDFAVKERILEITQVETSPEDDFDESMEDSLYRFRLDVFRTSVINSMLESRRRDLHSTIARVLKAKIDSKDSTSVNYRENLALFSHLKASGDSVNTASLALEIGKRFEKMGLFGQSLSLYNETLDLWNVASEDDDREYIGGERVNNMKHNFHI